MGHRFDAGLSGDEKASSPDKTASIPDSGEFLLEKEKLEEKKQNKLNKT